LTLLVSLERYITICHGLKYGWICTTKNGLRASAVIFVLAVIFNLPLVFAFGTLETKKDFDDTATLLRPRFSTVYGYNATNKLNRRSWTEDEFLGYFVNSSSFYVSERTEFGYTNLYRNYTTWARVLGKVIIPFFTIFSLNIFIIIKVSHNLDFQNSHID